MNEPAHVDWDTSDVSESPARPRPRPGVLALLLVAAAGTIAVPRNGVGAHPFTDFFAGKIAPALPQLPQGVPPLFQYVLWSPIGPALARCLGIATRDPYLALHAAVLVAGSVGLVWIVAARYAARTAVVVAALLATASTTTVVLAWTGSYDVFTVILASFLVVVRSPRLAALIGVLLAASALEHGMIIVALLLLLALAGIQGEPRALVAAAGGLVAGGIALVVWLRWQHVDHGRAYWLSNYGLRYFLDMAAHSWPLLLFSLFGAAWPLAAAAVAGVEPRRRLVAACVLAAPIIPMLISEDETRVFAVLSFPILLALVIAATDRAPALVQPAAIASVALSVVIPGYFVWKGTAHLADWGPWTALLR